MMQRTTFIRLSVSLAAATLVSATAQAQSKEPILIGVPAPMTGPNTQYGDELKAGLMTAIEAFNAAGGVNGKQIQLIEYDEEGDSAKAVTGYNSLVDQGVTAIIER